MAARITAADLDTLAARLEVAMIARGVHAEDSDWHLHVSKGAAPYVRTWQLWLTDDKGALAYVPGVGEHIGTTAREAHATLTGLLQGLRMVRSRDVAGFALRDEAIALDD